MFKSFDEIKSDARPPAQGVVFVLLSVVAFICFLWLVIVVARLFLG